MLFCTDDPVARETAQRLIRDVGFEPVFVGSLKQARYLEPLAMLWITMSQQQGREFALTIVRR
jgi:predicted dinucleotide-binding enzyme